MTAQKVVASSAADAVMIALLPNPEPNQCQFREGAILPSYIAMIILIAWELFNSEGHPTYIKYLS